MLVVLARWLAGVAVAQVDPPVEQATAACPAAAVAAVSNAGQLPHGAAAATPLSGGPGHTRQEMAASTKSRPPHIMLVLWDDLGYSDLGSFSDPRGDAPKTPFLDRLMADGVVMTSFYTQPLCSPARAALLTGRYPIRYGAQTGVLVLHPTFVPEAETLLSEHLAAAGYLCHIIGKWHLGYVKERWAPTGRGFQSFYGNSWGALDHVTVRAFVSSRVRMLALFVVPYVCHHAAAHDPPKLGPEFLGRPACA